MAFQWVFDNAATINLNVRNVTGQTQTRNGTVRAVSRGTMPKEYIVQMPKGIRWSTAAADIQAIDAAGLYTVESVTISNAGYNDWLINGDINSTPINVLCRQIPQWVITDIDLVQWSGPFIFVEDIT
jgi:hypothetical protein